MDDHVFCTPAYRGLLPPELHARFSDLDQFLRELAGSASSRLLIVAPYLSVFGLATIKGPLAASAQRGAWIRFVTGDLLDPNSWNHQALRVLVQGEDGEVIANRLRVLVTADHVSTLLHAKLLVVDRNRGYLGSANLSRGGMERNFEVGLALTANQADALDRLVDSLEARGFLRDRTSSIA